MKVYGIAAEDTHHPVEVINPVRLTGRGTGNANHRRGSSDVHEGLVGLCDAAKEAYEVSRIIDSDDIRREGWTEVELSENTATQEKAVENVVGHVKKFAGDSLRAVNAESASKISGVVRFHNRCAEAAVAEADKSASGTARIREITRNIAALVYPERSRGITGSGIIKGRDDRNTD